MSETVEELLKQLDRTEKRYIKMLDEADTKIYQLEKELNEAYQQIDVLTNSQNTKTLEVPLNREEALGRIKEIRKVFERLDYSLSNAELEKLRLALVSARAHISASLDVIDTVKRPNPKHMR